MEIETTSSGCCICWRAISQRCIQSRYKVSKENVQVIVKATDPHGVEIRKKQALWRRRCFSRGPDWAWHIDGYDKLKPFGFLIHGCIDGYSRRILWLTIVHSNSKAEIVGKLYLDYVKSVGGAPKEQKIHILLPSRSIFEEMVSINRPQRTVFYIVNLCQISAWKLTGRSWWKAAQVGGLISSKVSLKLAFMILLIIFIVNVWNLYLRLCCKENYLWCYLSYLEQPQN